jgi:hypothetical protein
MERRSGQPKVPLNPQQPALNALEPGVAGDFRHIESPSDAPAGVGWVHEHIR